MTVFDLDNGTVVGTPLPVTGDTSRINVLGTSSLGGVVVGDDVTVFATTRVENGDGTYTTKVTRIPGALPSSSSMMVMMMMFSGGFRNAVARSERRLSGCRRHQPAHP